MACCHSLITIDNEILGDPLEVKMLESTGWTLESREISHFTPLYRDILSTHPSLALITSRNRNRSHSDTQNMTNENLTVIEFSQINSLSLSFFPCIWNDILLTLSYMSIWNNSQRRTAPPWSSCRRWRMRIRRISETELQRIHIERVPAFTSSTFCADCRSFRHFSGRVFSFSPRRSSTSTEPILLHLQAPHLPAPHLELPMQQIVLPITRGFKTEFNWRSSQKGHRNSSLRSALENLVSFHFT